MLNLRIAVVGDIHGSWSSLDQDILSALNPDCVLFVGDLGERSLDLLKDITKLTIPIALILGNHDRGRDGTGLLLKAQLDFLGEVHCGWKKRNWDAPLLGVVGGRPCSSGGGFYLSPEVIATFGSMTLQQSADQISSAAEEVPDNVPLILLAHSGPSGLGSIAESPCGRDWLSPSVDWGDKDLEMALAQIRKKRIPDLVVFGHMHHQLRLGRGVRRTFCTDSWGTSYLNAACVPRYITNSEGDVLHHFSWVEFRDRKLYKVSHKWFRSDSTIASEQILFNRNI